MDNALIVLNALQKRLGTIRTVDEAKKIRDEAAAFESFAKTAKLGLTPRSGLGLRLGLEARGSREPQGRLGEGAHRATPSGALTSQADSSPGPPSPPGWNALVLQAERE